MKIGQISIDEYNYILEEERIAKYPLEKRDMSKLLLFKNGKIEDHKFIEIEKFIDSEELVIFNNTKVVRARLEFIKETGGKIEIFYLEPENDYNLTFQETKKCRWKCLIGNLRRWNKEILLEKQLLEGKIYAKRIETKENAEIIEFFWENGKCFGDILEEIGQIPIPPYLNRDSEPIDNERYQTIYAQKNGSVAAPTAGLHFTNEILDSLRNKKVLLDEVCLHVGAGTFKPVKGNDASEHQMHGETFSISKKTIENILKTGKVTAVGTTSMRALESLYWFGVKILSMNENDESSINILEQWDAYNLPQNISFQSSFEKLLNYLNKKQLNSFNGKTKIMIVPGYTFRVCNKLITNFHQPKSTLLLLVSAFIGNAWHDIYKHAKEQNYRFLSYGDSSILFRT